MIVDILTAENDFTDRLNQLISFKTETSYVKLHVRMDGPVDFGIFIKFRLDKDSSLCLNVS